MSLLLMTALIPAWASAQNTPPAQTPPTQDGERPQNPNTPPEWLEKQNSLGSAVLAPLGDLNLRKLDIPDILIAARNAPYELKGLETCAALSTEVTALDAVLGPDIDSPKSEDERNLTQKGQDMADRSAVGAVRDASTGIIPFRGMVRKVSGADRHQRDIEAAIEAGQSRRAFLKGTGMARNCAPPAAPYGFVPKVTIKPPAAKAPATKPPVKKKR
ncbi:MAG: hypothetical protein QM667_04245 [Asticcacaulis sp.]